jgi:DNA-binding transcriptional MerR regulator
MGEIVTSTTYTVSKLARMAGVSIRTLHHYDQIGLLHPSSRTPAGYRRYGQQELLRLQQILFFKELDLSLEEIRDILDDPSFDLVTALRQHRTLLQQRTVRLSRLLETVDNTLRSLTEDQMEMTDEELYEGFTKEEIERYKREAREQYDPEVVEAAERRVRKMSKAQWRAVGAEGEAISRDLTKLVGTHSPDDPEVQTIVARHHTWIEHFYPAPARVYTGLASLYTDHPEFRAFYEKYTEGLADFLAAGMKEYAKGLPEA